MLAPAFTAITSFQVIFFCKNDIAFRAQVIIFRIEILVEHLHKDIQYTLFLKYI